MTDAAFNSLLAFVGGFLGGFAAWAMVGYFKIKAIIREIRRGK